MEPTDSADSFKVLGRGELQLAILIETMRREGFELAISNPEVITRIEDGVRKEPLELLVLDLPETYMGVVLEKMAHAQGQDDQDGEPRLGPRAPGVPRAHARPDRHAHRDPDRHARHGGDEHAARGLHAVAGRDQRRQTGVLVADRTGDTTPTRSRTWRTAASCSWAPGVAVYEGMIVGENARPADMDVNVTKQKKLTNMRASTADEAIRLTPHRALNLEQALEFINDDELVEVTPTAIRLRKRILAANMRPKKRAEE